MKDIVVRIKGIKRYKIIIAHEVIIYAENEKDARRNLFRNPEMKLRTNLQCVSVTEIPLPEDEPPRVVIDNQATALTRGLSKAAVKKMGYSSGYGKTNGAREDRARIPR